jgi:hypothetical protein
MGRRFLEEGAAHLVIWDIDDGALRRVARELSASGHKVSGFRVDIQPAANRDGGQVTDGSCTGD